MLCTMFDQRPAECVLVDKESKSSCQSRFEMFHWNKSYTKSLLLCLDSSRVDIRHSQVVRCCSDIYRVDIAYNSPVHHRSETGLWGRKRKKSSLSDFDTDQPDIFHTKLAQSCFDNDQKDKQNSSSFQLDLENGRQDSLRNPRVCHRAESFPRDKLYSCFVQSGC